MYVGPTFALLQRLVPDQMRATALATVMLVCNLVGMGLGPQIVGSLSDWLAPLTGQQSLRFALLIVSCCAMWAAYHFWQAGNTARDDLRAGNGIRVVPREVAAV
jgi:MFS family permease